MNSKLDRWYAHVSATPSGHVPVLINGSVPAWRLIWRREDIERNFKLWPRKYWPKWVKEVL